ncbi:MAG: nitroreductase family protein [Caldicoprobacter sp.]|uniref:nitroreductase family protein n=1 Tax=Caldicoprobacter sp. TaxID=2004500 RepID=UPI001E109F01|nr:nitroreductase family protein [Clostridia bacterium]
MDKQQILNFFFKRRSIRKYKDMDVSQEDIDIILRAAMSAPSAGNQQPWHFIVVDDRQKMKEITKYHPYSSMLNTAPKCIIVAGDTSSQRYEGYWVQDCAAATQNMLLAIAQLGLGGVWLGVHPRKEREEAIRRIFNIPEHIVPFAIVALGVPDEEKGPSDRYNPERVHVNTW